MQMYNLFFMITFIVFQHQYIDWKHAHNVRNFSISQGNVGESGCIWECKDNHVDSIFALTRRVGDVLTCSCAYANAFNFDMMVLPEFCQLNDDQVAKDSSDSDFYHLNCVTDLDEGNGISVRKKMFFEFCPVCQQSLVLFDYGALFAFVCVLLESSADYPNTKCKEFISNP